MGRIPIIIDTDPGIDDALAIAISLFSDDMDVKLISTVAGNVGIENVTYNARRLLKYLGKEDIPIAKGAESPIIRELDDASAIHGASGLEGFEFEEPDMDLLGMNAVDAMRQLILGSEEKITIMAIGPLTNVALLLKTYPEVKQNIEEIVFMGGSITRGNKGVMSEFNIHTDPEAAYIVVHSGLKITMVGLDIGMKALITPNESEKLKDMNKTGTMAYSLFKKYRSGSFESGLRMFDSTAVAFLLRPDMFEIQHTHVDIELGGRLTAGCTLVDLENYLGKEPNVSVCTDIDETEFIKWFIDSVEKCI